MNPIKNILADRYASSPIKDIWSEEGKTLLEREFWIAVMKAQKELGISIEQEAIEQYEKVKDQIDLVNIKKREKTLRHDVKAKIEEFCELAGFQHIHKGLTSRDLTDNVEQFQIFKSLQYVKLKTVQALNLLAEKANLYQKMVIAGKTHNVAAQPTTLGKRFAMFGEDIFYAFTNIEHLISVYPLRGIKGAVGTLLDIKTLLNNDSEKISELEKKVADFLGFNNVINCVGQVYPRSMDFQVIASLYQIGSGITSFCKTIRIMAGHELVSEGFQKGQVGSSAMPHKMNSRNCERVCGFLSILSGHLSMSANLCGDQWNEGDVSCSVVRRAALADAFFAIDGMLETFMVILKEMVVFENMIQLETNRYLPFLISTTFLMEAVKKGGGRESMHEIIKKHSHDVIESLRSGKETNNNLIAKLGSDPEFPLSDKDLESIINNPDIYLGEACMQVEKFCVSVNDLTKKYPDAGSIVPQSLI